MKSCLLGMKLIFKIIGLRGDRQDLTELLREHRLLRELESVDETGLRYDRRGQCRGWTRCRPRGERS